MLDPSGHVATWNAGAKRIQGYDAEEIVGHHFSQFFPAESVADGAIAQRIATETEVSQRLKRADEALYQAKGDGRSSFKIS